MFNFRLINLANGNQVIDKSLKTPYASLTPLQMIEYIEIDNKMAYIESIERKKIREAKNNQNFIFRLIHKIVCNH